MGIGIPSNQRISARPIGGLRYGLTRKRVPSAKVPSSGSQLQKLARSVLGHRGRERCFRLKHAILALSYAVVIKLVRAGPTAAPREIVPT
jgi:hypothetical protein